MPRCGLADACTQFGRHRHGESIYLRHAYDDITYGGIYGQRDTEPQTSAGHQIPLEVRKQRVDTKASRLAALGATQVADLSEEGLDHYAIAMRDPEGNEFDIN